MLSINNMILFDMKYFCTLNIGNYDGNMNSLKTFHIILCYLC